MAFFDSNSAVFQITDTGGTLRDISAYIIAINGLPGPRELNDVTALGDTGRKWFPTLQDVTITLELLYDDTATTGPEVILGPLRTHTAAVAFDYGPKGKTATFLKYSGTCWVRDFEITTQVGRQVMSRLELKVQGVVTRGTY